MSNKNKNGQVKLESTYDLDAALPFFPYGYNYGGDLFNSSPAYGFYGDGYPQYTLTRRDNRLAGEVLPIYINWFQLKLIRDEARRICTGNEYAQSAINAFRNYAVNTGFTYHVLPRYDGVDEGLIRQTQELLDLFSEHNFLSEMEREICYRLHCDGEAFIRMFPQSDGLIKLRFIEPELVRPPADDTTPDESFGVVCADQDIHDIVGYYVIERPYLNLTPTLVPADEIVHLKLNVNSNSKRGLPTVWSIQSNLRAAEDVLQSLISLAKARAKIAMIKRINDSPPDSIEELTRNATDVTLTDPLTGQKTNLNHYGYGTVLTSSGNVEYQFPSLQMGSADLIDTLQVNLRAIASRFGLSETMLSADASNNNYASALIAEAPAVKTFQAFQAMLGRAIAERRTKPQRSIMWNQVSHAVRMGLLPQEALTQLTIKAKGPQVISRNDQELANVNKIYMDMHIKSPQEIAAELGLNYEQQQKNFEILKGNNEKASTTPSPQEASDR